MGKFNMNQKKILSITLVSLMLISTVVAIAPTASATAYHALWGKLNINGAIAGPGVKIHLTVPSKSFTTDITTTSVDSNGYNFYAGFDNPTYHGAKAYFTLLPRPTTETNSITLDKKVESVEQYFLVLDFTNSHPTTPSSPNPTNGATGVETSADLSWTCSDPDGDPITYDVYFGTTNPPTTRVSSNQIGTTYDPGTLGSSTTYYWQIVAKDNIVWDIGYTSGPVWSFTTKTGSTGGGTGGDTGGPGGGTTTPEGGVLTADADGPYFGAPNSAITFDGTQSSDTDGTIIQYDWKFFNTDTWWNNIGSTPTHTYTEEGTYQVSLRVTDDDGNTDEDTTTATITAGNNPPTKPTLTGNTTGNKNVEYTYAAVSTDPDGDTISYTFNWGDGESTTTGYYPSGTSVDNATHTWAYAGVYNIWVQATDNKTSSDKTYLTMLIDTIKAGELGYIIDIDGDSIYDEFETLGGSLTNITKQADGTYLIDSDGDGDWEWIYDPQTDTLTPYSSGASGETSVKDNTIWYALVAGTIIAILVILLIFIATKKKKGK